MPPSRFQSADKLTRVKNGTFSGAVYALLVNIINLTALSIDMENPRLLSIELDLIARRVCAVKRRKTEGELHFELKLMKKREPVEGFAPPTAEELTDRQSDRQSGHNRVSQKAIKLQQNQTQT